MPTLADLPKARVVVVGDYMIDRWIYGRVERISPEAPVPVFVQERVEEMNGGAGNVLANMQALGANPLPISPPSSQWSIKTRFVANGQQIFRCDQDQTAALDERLTDWFPKDWSPQVIVISDYAKGVCTPDLCQRLIGWAKEHKCKVVVDPKDRDWLKYRGAYVITPNVAEASDALMENFDGHMLVTLGANGMDLHELQKPPLHIHATAREVFDVVGAGDTVVAVLAAALAVGFDLPEAAKIANAAAGVTVSKRGTATCSLAELEEAYARA